MKYPGALATLSRCILAAAVLCALAPAQADSPTPPKNLKKVGDHWTPWDPPEPNPDSYIIVPGDNLWDLAGRWLGDNYLWPQIWDENRYILDSHWIYPGDPLTIPGRPTVVPDTGPPPVVEVPDTADAGAGTVGPPRGKTAPEPMELLAAPADLYCSGYVDSAWEASDVRVAGMELEQVSAASGNVIYLDRGRDAGLAAGDEFLIVRNNFSVTHPVTGAAMGEYVQRLGKARVMVAHDTTSTAIIASSCSDVRRGDSLLRWADIPMPQRASMPDWDRYTDTPSGGPTGYVVFTKDDVAVVGEGQIVSVDLGELSGIRPGDVLNLYRENDDLPRLNLGQAVVLTVQPETSAALITLSVREMWVGDRVEVARQ